MKYMNLKSLASLLCIAVACLACGPQQGAACAQTSAQILEAAKKYSQEADALMRQGGTLKRAGKTAEAKAKYAAAAEKQRAAAKAYEQVADILLKEDGAQGEKRSTAKTDPQEATPAPAGQAKTKAPALEETFKQLIRARYEKKAAGPRDPSTTVIFQRFQVGVTHKWRPGVGGQSPDGPSGNFGTTVYPVKAVYAVRTDYPDYAPTGYRGEIQEHDNDNTFYCLKNQFGDWQCNLGEGKTGDIRHLPK